MFTDDNFLVLLVIFGLCYWTPGYSISEILGYFWNSRCNDSFLLLVVF